MTITRRKFLGSSLAAALSTAAGAALAATPGGRLLARLPGLGPLTRRLPHSTFNIGVAGFDLIRVQSFHDGSLAATWMGKALAATIDPDGRSVRFTNTPDSPSWPRCEIKVRSDRPSELDIYWMHFIDAATGDEPPMRFALTYADFSTNLKYAPPLAPPVLAFVHHTGCYGPSASIKTHGPGNTSLESVTIGMMPAIQRNEG